MCTNQVYTKQEHSVDCFSFSITTSCFLIFFPFSTLISYIALLIHVQNGDDNSWVGMGQRKVYKFVCLRFARGVENEVTENIGIV